MTEAERHFLDQLAADAAVNEQTVRCAKAAEHMHEFLRGFTDIEVLTVVSLVAGDAAAGVRPWATAPTRPMTSAMLLVTTMVETMTDRISQRFRRTHHQRGEKP